VAFGAVLVVLAAGGIPALPLALLGAGFGLIGSVVVALVAGSRRPPNPVDPSEPPPALATDTALARLSQVLHEALASVAGRPDGIPKDVARQKLMALGVQFRAVAVGTGTAGATESWYVAHDAVLAAPDLREYLAVVRVPAADYARDPAVRESLRATFAAAYRGVLVERILILPEALWPAGRLLPTDDIRPWVEEQHDHGLRVILVREGQLAADPDAPVDTCVFDDWAVGTRELDDRERTTRVALDFAPDAIRAALDRLGRLSHLGISFRDLLDRDERGG
jgi:hypothetical protein